MERLTYNDGFGGYGYVKDFDVYSDEIKKYIGELEDNQVSFGKWEKGYCSNCGYRYDPIEGEKTNFCPECGSYNVEPSGLPY